jgi:ankyrin repeat protein
MRKIKVMEKNESKRKQRLKEAAANGKRWRVKWYVFRGVSQNSLDSAMIETIKNGHLDIVKLLHKKGANIRFKGPTGTTLLMLAAVMDYLDIVKYLHRHGADIHAVNDNGETALIKAAKANRLEIVKYLVSHKADIHQRDIHGNDALLWAAKGEYPEVYIYLSEQGADPNVYNKDKMTAGLYLATWKTWKNVK